MVAFCCAFLGGGEGWDGGRGVDYNTDFTHTASSFITHPCAGRLVSVLFHGIYLQLVPKKIYISQKTVRS